MCVHVYLLVIVINCLCQRLNFCVCANVGSGCTTVAMHLYIYVKYGSHICSVIYVKYVCSFHCNIVDCSDFICGTYIVYISHRSLKYVAYMPNVVGILVSSPHLVITWEVCISVDCILSHMCKIVGSICPFNMLLVWLTYACMLMLCIEFYIDNFYIHLPLSQYLGNLPIYTNVIT